MSNRKRDRKTRGVDVVGAPTSTSLNDQVVVQGSKTPSKPKDANALSTGKGRTAVKQNAIASRSGSKASSGAATESKSGRTSDGAQVEDASRNHAEASRRAAEKRRQQNRNEWKRALRLFWLKNRTMLTVVLAVFIVVEGSVVWFYPAQWWKPVLAVASVSVVLMLWRNMKAAFKCVLSLALTIMMAALAVQSGYAYGGMNTAALWGMAVLTGWAVAVLISYVAHPMTSRWTISLVSAAVGFMMGYTFMPLGMIPVGVATILGAILMEVSFLAGEALRRKMGAFRPAKEWQTKEYGRLQKTMKSLWPDMKAVGVKLLGSWSTTVWYGVDCPTVVMVPLDLDESLNDSKRWGLTYHHRNIQSMASWIIMKIARIVREPAPVVVFIDQYGINEASKGDAETMGFKMNDSVNYVYAGIMDGSVTSVTALRKTMTALVRRFQGLEYATAKQTGKMDKEIGRDWTNHLAKTLKRHEDLKRKISKAGSIGTTKDQNGSIASSYDKADGMITKSGKAGVDTSKVDPTGKGTKDTDAKTPKTKLDRNGHEVKGSPLSKQKERDLHRALDKLDL